MSNVMPDWLRVVFACLIPVVILYYGYLIHQVSNTNNLADRFYEKLEDLAKRGAKR